MPNAEKKYHPWLQEALDAGFRMEAWFEVIPATEQAMAWENYFRRLAWHPKTFERLFEGKSWTAPCEWPEHVETLIRWRPKQHQMRSMPDRVVRLREARSDAAE